MTKFNLWDANKANEALVIINFPSKVVCARFNKPPVVNQGGRFGGRLALKRVTVLTWEE